MPHYHGIVSRFSAGSRQAIETTLVPELVDGVARRLRRVLSQQRHRRDDDRRLLLPLRHRERPAARGLGLQPGQAHRRPRQEPHGRPSAERRRALSPRPRDPAHPRRPHRHQPRPPARRGQHRPLPRPRATGRRHPRRALLHLLAVPRPEPDPDRGRPGPRRPRPNAGDRRHGNSKRRRRSYSCTAKSARRHWGAPDVPSRWPAGGSSAGPSATRWCSVRTMPPVVHPAVGRKQCSDMRGCSGCDHVAAEAITVSVRTRVTGHPATG